MFERHLRSSQRALDLLFARCAADPGCHAAFPDPAGDLHALTAQLDRGPVRLPLTDPATGQPVTVTRQDLESWARLRRADTHAAAGSYLSYDDVRAIIAPGDVCAATPRPQPAALYGALTVVPVPMLLLNGQADPQDPPAGVASARRNYPSSLVLAARGQAHRYTGVACLATIIGAFIDRASTVAPSSVCLAEVPVPPFDLG